MRGQQSLAFLDFSEPPKTVTIPLLPGRGRSKELIERRNNKILVRYYYHNSICNKKWNEAIECLINEFDLDDRTISNIIKSGADHIHDMRQKKPSVDSLKKLFAWPKW